jgi:hypothetical protein
MLFDVRVFFEDYNDEEASTGIKLIGANSLADVSAFVLQYASVLEGLSTAYVSKAEARTKFSPTTPQIVKGQSSSYDRLIVLCTNGERYASITLPAPSPLPYLSQGPYAGYKVDKSAPSGLEDLQALLTFLAGTVLPDGSSFPTTSWEAALMRQP